MLIVVLYIQAQVVGSDLFYVKIVKGMKDEYIRNFSFDPELIQKRDSNDTSHDHKAHKKSKVALRKLPSVERHESQSESDEADLCYERSIIDAEVYSFCTVNMKY